MMKKISIAIIALFITATVSAQTLPVKLYEITEVKVKNSFKNATGKELNAFQVPADANSIKLSVQVPVKDYKKYVLQNQLQLMIVNNKTKENIQNVYWSTLYKDTVLVTECYFPAGEYSISLVDQVHPEKIFANRTIAVKGEIKTGTTGIIKINGYNYDVSKFKLWTCSSVDETNWKPIEVKSKIATGSCITFFFESTEKIKNPGTMRWKLYKVEPGGKETFVNQKDQTLTLEQFRRMYYEECSEFNSKGTYRIYLAVKNESDEYYGVRDKEYFAMAQVEVE
jgi:hypothetical protein